VAAFKTCNAEFQARITHSLCKLAGLRRILPLQPRRFAVGDGVALYCDLVLRDPTSAANKRVLRSLALQVLAALSRGSPADARAVDGG
ncbi:hypothetical protein OH407_24370, partial [Salmonella enterica]|uniref:hypothetical protein n=1 Tax=Salmonella enterica TaxID=28901 RepID=UPI0022B6FD99